MSVVCQFMHRQSDEHMESVYRILRYIKSCQGKGVLFERNGNLEISKYTDADWVGDQTDRKSTLGYFLFVENNLVSLEE